MRLRGFALIELLIVVAMAAILLSAAVPQVRRSMSSTRLLAAADELASELNMARTLAVSRNAIYEMRFNDNDRTFQAVDPWDAENPPRLRRQLQPGIRFSNVPTQPIRFLSRGNARGGQIQLSDEFGLRVNVQVSNSGLVEIGNIR